MPLVNTEICPPLATHWPRNAIDRLNYDSPLEILLRLRLILLPTSEPIVFEPNSLEALTTLHARRPRTRKRPILVKTREHQINQHNRTSEAHLLRKSAKTVPKRAAWTDSPPNGLG